MMGELAKVSFVQRIHSRPLMDGADMVGMKLENAGSRIRDAAKSGTISEEEAWDKWHHQSHRIIEGATIAGDISEDEAHEIRLDVERATLMERVKVAVEKGEISEEQAHRKIEGIEREFDGKDRDRDDHVRELVEHFEELGIEKHGIGRIKRALAETGIRDNHIREALWVVVKVAYEIKEKGEDCEMDHLWNYMHHELDLNDEQIDRVTDIARGILHRGEDKDHDEDYIQELMERFREMAVTDDEMILIKNHLMANGIGQEQLVTAFEGILKVTHAMDEKGDSYEVCPEMERFLEHEARLSGDQIDVVHEIARKILEKHR